MESDHLYKYFIYKESNNHTKDKNAKITTGDTIVHLK